MQVTNENSRLACRYLSSNEFTHIHQTFIAAFADYLVKFELTERQFQNHIILNAVDLNRSVGCTAGNGLAGLSLNGFGMWKGKKTIYDAGTAVLPQYRRRGVSRAMFEWMVPQFADEGYEQFLLEVITHNEPAVRLYDRLGFRTTRELLLLEADAPVTPDRPLPDGIEVREIHRHENIPFASFWEGMPSWQNSPDAIQRSLQMKRLFGAFIDDECVGYTVFSAGVGRLAQLAVRRDYRRLGIATHLLLEMQNDAADQKLHVINLDESMTESVIFFQNRGFKKVLGQFEMIKEL